MKNHTFSIRAHYFCGLMGEAICEIVRADNLEKESLRMRCEGDNSQAPLNLLSDAGSFARYAFLLACNAYENSAHTILVNSGKLSSSLAEDIDRLSALNKFEVFALIHGKTIDRGDDRYAKIRQVIRCRNDFVHPKGLSVQILNSDKAEARLSGGREYPIAFDFIELNQVVLMIGDILRFVAWVVFDICEFSPSAGAKLINGEIKWWMSQFHDAQTLWKYDLRSLGNFENVKVTTISLSSSKKHRTIRRSRNVRKK